MEQNSNPGDPQRRPEPELPPEVTSTEQPVPLPVAEDFATAYARQMHEGEQQYEPALTALNSMGLPASFTQTGGMCAAIEITLESGYFMWATDEDGPLSWRREEHEGWAVGLYRDPADEDEAHDWQEPLRFETTSDGSTEALVELVRQVLNPQSGK